jgi:hypothetical protein
LVQGAPVPPAEPRTTLCEQREQRVPNLEQMEELRSTSPFDEPRTSLTKLDVQVKLFEPNLLERSSTNFPTFAAASKEAIHK